VKLSLAASVKDMQIAIRESEQRQRDGMSEEIARSIEGFEGRWSQHMRQQLEQHQDEQVSRMNFLQQIQEEAADSGRTDAAAAQSQLDRVNAALRDLLAEHAAQHERLAVQVQQLEGCWLSSRKDRDLASRELAELQGELSLIAEQVLLPQWKQAGDTNGATNEGLQGMGAKITDLQTSLASVNKHVSKLGQDLVQMRTQHLVDVVEVGSCAERYAKQAAQRGSAASGEAAESRFQELATKIHAVQVATTGEIFGLTQDLASMRSNLGDITEAVAQAASASIKRTEARLAAELDSKCDELAKFVGAQHEDLRLKASSFMGTVSAERVSQEKEGRGASAMSVTSSATGSETQAHPDSLNVGSMFGVDAKAVIVMLRQCVGQVDALRKQLGDLQPRVLMLEREGATSDSKTPAQTATSKACTELGLMLQQQQRQRQRQLMSPQMWPSPSPPDLSASRQPMLGPRFGTCDAVSVNTASSAAGTMHTLKLTPATPGKELGRSRLSWAESYLLPGSLPERENSAMSVQPPVPSDSGAERQLCHAVPGLAAAAASIRPLQQPSAAAMRSRNLPIACCAALPPCPQSLPSTSPCAMRHSSCATPTLSAMSTISAQHSPRKDAAKAMAPGRLQVLWPPSAGQDIVAGSVAGGFAERQPLRVIGVD